MGSSLEILAIFNQKCVFRIQTPYTSTRNQRLFWKFWSMFLSEWLVFGLGFQLLARHFLREFVTGSLGHKDAPGTSTLNQVWSSDLVCHQGMGQVCF